MTAEIINLFPRRRPSERTGPFAHLDYRRLSTQILALRAACLQFGWAVPADPKKARIQMAALIMHLGVAMGEAIQSAPPDIAGAGPDPNPASRRSKPKAAIRLAVAGEVDDFNGPKAS
jgi:hypothetical protein